MSGIESQRPTKLYRYSERHWLQRSLDLGEFRLRPPFGTGRMEIARPVSPNSYLTLSLTKAWSDTLFEQFSNADSCLIIHDTEEFGERIHRAAQKMLPSWTGIDAAVSYGVRSPLGAVFSKGSGDANQEEWLFAWRPTQITIPPSPIFIQIGNIEDIAQLCDKGSMVAALH